MSKVLQNTPFCNTVDLHLGIIGIVDGNARIGASIPTSFWLIHNPEETILHMYSNLKLNAWYPRRAKKRRGKW